MLDELHKDYVHELWAMRASDKDSLGSVVGVDFYNAGALLPLRDEDLLRITVNDLLSQVEPAFRDVKVLDYDVQRYQEAVSWFSPGSYENRPRTRVEGIQNLFCAGDWVVIQDPLILSKENDFNVNEHGAKGLCQERAYVSGLVAANCILTETKDAKKIARVLPIRDDELQVVLGRTLNKQFFGTTKAFCKLLTPPWKKD